MTTTRNLSADPAIRARQMMTKEERRAFNASQPWATRNMFRTDARGRKHIDLNFQGGNWACYPSNFGQADSFLIYTTPSKPGEYFTETGVSVPVEVAQKAGVPVAKHMLAKRRAELQAKADKIVSDSMAKLNQRVDAVLAAELEDEE